MRPAEVGMPSTAVQEAERKKKFNKGQASVIDVLG